MWNGSQLDECGSPLDMPVYCNHKPMLTYYLPEEKYLLEVAKLLPSSWQLSCHTPAYDQLTQEEPLNNAVRFPCHSIPYPWSFNCLVILVIQGHNIVFLYRWMASGWQEVSLTTASVMIVSTAITYNQHIQSKRSWYDMIWDTIDFDLIGKNTLGGWIHQSKYFRWNSCMTDFLLLIYSYQPIFFSLRSKKCTTSMLLKQCQKSFVVNKTMPPTRFLRLWWKTRNFPKPIL